MNQIHLHPSALPVERLLAECDTRRGRRRGPGGQHRNKVETAIVITHKPTGVKGEASERRSQEENRRAAVFRLRVNLALNVRTPRQESEMPSDLWQSRCRSGRISISNTHEDFPTLLAEALDVLAACDMDIRSAAETLAVTASQLIRFLKIAPNAMAQVNKHRRKLGLHRLH
ncbi:MAG: peptide chain release factor-like protein [Pirellulaceae bacterium]|nr:peptide chain release factor-like protein [Pirellulaceae bacterium]